MSDVSQAQPVDSMAELSIQRLIAGDGLEFDRFVEQYQPKIAKLVSRLLGWSQDSRDVVQDVIVDVLKGFKTFRQESSVDTWLTQITINACRRHQRRLVLRRMGLGILTSRHDHDEYDASTQEGLDDETLASVRSAVRELPTREREVVVLRYLEQIPIADIATLLGISKNNTEVRLHRGRERLRQLLSELNESDL
ncbi:MAG: hypothetical protein DHS20C16_06060 [Phycisphaerae bacterium]|nr:MAG: hypothetical protein DHS20C16_06060 [Phycisphaerae bacterium]